MARTTSALERTLLVTAAICVGAGACNGVEPPTEPEGGLHAFVEALAAGTPDRVYERLAPETRTLCSDALDTLRETEDAIGQLQPSDQIDARRNTGVGLLDRIETDADLFAELTDLTAIPPLDEGGRYRTGLKPSNTVTVAGDTVLIVTRSGQEFELVHCDDGEWRVREPMHSILRNAVAAIDTNRERVDEAVALFGVGQEIEDRLHELGLLD